MYFRTLNKDAKIDKLLLKYYYLAQYVKKNYIKIIMGLLK